MQSRNSKNIKVIDVSHHNAIKNWLDIKKDGVKGIYIKLTEGTSFISPKAYEYYLAAKNVGLRVGFYHYAHANNDPIKEVDFFLEKLGNMKVDLPHCLDLEENKGKSKAQVNAFGLKWMQYLEKKTGITPILYTGYSFMNNFSSAAAKYPLWVARYSGSNRVGGMNNPGSSPIWNKWAMFQYTDSGKVKGISGNVDINEMDIEFFNSIDSGVTVIGDANPPSSYRKGDSGLGVKELQQNLLKLGEQLPRYGADGSFGDELEQAVKAFQARNKLTVDGIAGENTLAKITELFKAAPVKEPVKEEVKEKPKQEEKKPSGDNTMKAIQIALNSRYKAKLTVDGLYGSNTKTALVKGLQTELNKQYRANLKVDGVFGKATLNKVVPLKEGAAGNITYILQATLYSLGYDTNGVDGKFGKGTTTAVKKFQKDKKLSTDGVCGVNTWNKLF